MLVIYLFIYSLLCVCFVFLCVKQGMNDLIISNYVNIYFLFFCFHICFFLLLLLFLLCPRIYKQVWTPCLMHRCVCIWQNYILQNYNYKLHFQNLFIYNIPHVSIRTWPLKILMFAPWDSNIQLTMGIDQRRQIYPNVVQLVSK
jgi:hypothetical protein